MHPRRLFAQLSLVTLSLLIANAAFGGTVYVVVAGDGPVGEVSYETVLVVTNTTEDLLFVALDFIPGIVDGSRLPSDPEPQVYGLPAGETRVFTGLTRGLASAGMVSVTGDDRLVVDARLRVTGSEGQSDFVQLPVVSSRDLLSPNRLHVLPGWYRSDTSRTSFGLINVSGETNECTLDLRELLGSELMPTVVLSLPNETMILATDAVGLVGLSTLAEGRLELTCTAPFYTFGLITDVETGQVSRREVAVDLVSTLASDFEEGDEGDPGDPGDEPDVGGGSEGDPSRGVVVETAPGLVRLRVPGLVHAPRRGNDRWIYRLDIPSLSTIESITATVVVRPGPWGNLRSRPQHHLLQISNARWGDGGWDYWVRPAGDGTQNGLIATHGRGAGNEVVRGSLGPLPPTYRVTINQRGRTLEGEGLRINQGIFPPRAEPLFIQLGADLGATHDAKVPSYGWSWHDLEIEIRGR